MIFLATPQYFLRLSGVLLMIWAGLLVSGCKKGSDAPATPFSEGRKVYTTYCLACHNLNPTKPGGIGPEIWKSSRLLIEAKVLKNQYPEGYQPKRATKIMTTFPLSQEQITNLEAFLNAPEAADYEK